MRTRFGVNKDTIDQFYDVRFGADISREAWSIALPQWANSRHHDGEMVGAIRELITRVLYLGYSSCVATKLAVRLP